MGLNHYLAPAVRKTVCELIVDLSEELKERFESLEDASARAGYLNRILRQYANDFKMYEQMAERQIENRPA